MTAQRGTGSNKAVAAHFVLANALARKTIWSLYILSYAKNGIMSVIPRNLKNSLDALNMCHTGFVSLIPAINGKRGYLIVLKVMVALFATVKRSINLIVSGHSIRNG
jgi:hypothetical protein